MQQKMSINEYRNSEFTPQSRPTRSTVARWIRNGTLPGIKIGGRLWVYVHPTEADALVQRVLNP